MSERQTMAITHYPSHTKEPLHARPDHDPHAAIIAIGINTNAAPNRQHLPFPHVALCL